MAISLAEDLQKKKSTLLEFKEITLRVLQYLPSVISGFEIKSGYKIHYSHSAGSLKYFRPINQRLFIYSYEDFIVKYDEFLIVLDKIKFQESTYTQEEKDLIDSVTYTIQQAIGAGFDHLVSPNSARKHVGNRFEELVRCVFTEVQIANKRTVLKVPYNSEDGQKIYKCENDLIISPYEKVRSTSTTIDEKEIVVSTKTTSKDRMGKMFIDKLLLERILGHPQKVIGIFLNDVQRKESNNISFTLVSGLFMVYTKFLIELEGIYYLDPPPNCHKKPYSDHMKPFSELLTTDIWRLFAS